MSRRITLTAILATVAVCGAAVSLSQDNDAADEPSVDPEAINQLFVEYATPGPQHEVFGHVVGEWDVEVTSFMPDPENPDVSEGTATFELLMGGRYVQQNFESEMHGEAFHGMSIKGYDNALQEYVSSWIDDMGTGIMRAAGTIDEETGIMTEVGESSSPIGTINYRMITEPKGVDEFLFTMYMAMPGADEERVMEITYTRREE